MRLSIITAACSILVFCHSRARAEGARFGQAGELVISDDQPITVLSTAFSEEGTAPLIPGSQSTVSFQYATVNQNGGSGVSFALAPAVDWFPVSNFSIGAEVLFGVVNFSHPAGSTNSTGILVGVAPRIGVNIPFSDSFSLWPKVYFSFANTSDTSGDGVGSRVGAIGLFAPVVWRPVPHFFLGLGPNVSTVLFNDESEMGVSTSGPKVTQFGLQATIGGYFGG